MYTVSHAIMVWSVENELIVGMIECCS